MAPNLSGRPTNSCGGNLSLISARCAIILGRDGDNEQWRVAVARLDTRGRNYYKKLNILGEAPALPEPVATGASESSASFSQIKVAPVAPLSVEPSPPPILVGEQFPIIRFAPSTGFYCEGLATVRAVVNEVVAGCILCDVEFCGERIWRRRVVHPAFQRQPEQILVAMRNVWQSGAIQADAMADFWTDDFI